MGIAESGLIAYVRFLRVGVYLLLVLPFAVVAQTVTLSPTTLNFANQAVGTASPVKNVTLSNTGTVALSITSVTSSAPFAQTNTCGTSVAAKAKCTISVTFSPKKTGTITANLKITDNASNSPQSVSLAGTGVTGVSLSPTSVTFPSQNVGTTSAAIVSTLANYQSTTLSITSVTVSGDFAQTNTCGTSLLSNSKCTISTTFTPTVAGARTGVVTITDNATTSPQTINLTGTGNSAAALNSITLSPGSAQLSLGKTLQMTATGTYSDGSTQNLTSTAKWTSSNSTTATVLAGLISAAKAGSTSIQASFSGVSSALAPVNVGTGSDYFVATNGNDAWSGTLASPNGTKTDGPFATIAKAQTAVQSLIAGANGRTTPITVQVRAGTYYQQSLTFTSADSGTSTLPVVWANYPNESPIFSGGMLVTGWVNIGNNTFQTTLPQGTKYFENLFYNGTRRLRPRVGGGVGTYLNVANTVFLPTNSDPNCAVNVAGSGWECFDRFYYTAGDLSANWTNLNSPYPAGDIELLDFELWSVPKMRIKSIDSINNIVYLTGPTKQGAGVHGYLKNHRYVVENVKDLLTQAGQWFLDTSVSPYVLTYIANTSENPLTATVIASQSAQVMTATGLQYVTFQGLQFEHDNFTIPAGGYVSAQQEVSLTGAVSCYNCQHVTFNSDIIAMTSGSGIEFYTTDKTLSTAYNMFENGALWDIGGMGIRVGTMPAASDTDASVAQFTTIQNNLIEGYGRVIPSAVGIVQGSGHDNLYTHNDIYDGYHSGMEICIAPSCSPGTSGSSGSFNNTASFNHVYDLYQGVTDDGGGIYFATGGSAFIPSGNQILNNKIHDLNDASIIDSDGYGGYGINLDGGTGLVTVENNLIYRVSSMGINITHGPQLASSPNTIINNIFAYARKGMIANGNPFWSGSCPSSPTQDFTSTSNLFYFDRNATQQFYVQQGCEYSCGLPLTTLHNWQSNLFWRLDGVFGADPDAFHNQVAAHSPGVCGTSTNWTYYNFSGWQALGEDLASSTTKNPGFKNPAYPNDDYSLPAGSPGFGFVVFDSSQAGRSNPIIKSTNPIDVPATFTTTLFNPATDF
jgi:hypothetical protein